MIYFQWILTTKEFNQKFDGNETVYYTVLHVNYDDSTFLQQVQGTLSEVYKDSVGVPRTYVFDYKIVYELMN